MSNVKAYLEDIVRDGLHDIAEALKGGGPAGDVQASHVIYDNTASGLTSNRVQGAIDELSTKVDTNISGISDLTTRIGTAEGDITSLDERLDTAEEDITALESWKNNLDASDIPYGSGTVKDALDRLPIEIKIVQGTTPSAINTYAVISDFPTGWNANNTYVVGFVFSNSSNLWASNFSEINVITTESIGIRVRVTSESFVSRPIKVMLARIV